MLELDILGRLGLGQRAVHTVLAQPALPKIRWAAEFQQFNDKDVWKPQTRIDKTVTRYWTGRSPWLQWCATDSIALNPFNLVQAEASWAHQRRLYRQARAGWHALPQRHVTYVLTPHFLDTLRKWGWPQLSDSTFATQLGHLDIPCDTKATIQKCVRHAFVLWHAQFDNRAAPGHKDMTHRVPIFDAHQATRYAKNQPWIVRAAALAATPDSRNVDKQTAISWCPCRTPNPDRRHLAWHCARTPSSGDFVGLVEERLCVRCIPLPPALKQHDLPINDDLVEALRTAKPVKDSLVPVAADGGATSFHQYHQRAGTGIAVFDATHGHCSFATGSALLGADQTSWGAEIDALEQVVWVAVRACTSVFILIDNRAVLDSFQALLLGNLPLPRFGFGTCLRIKSAFRQGFRCGISFGAEWIPSHGKTTQWRASGPLDTQQARELNRIADPEASREANLHYHTCDNFIQNAADAKSWSALALNTVSKATERWLRYNQTRFSTQLISNGVPHQESNYPEAQKRTYYLP